MGGFFALYFRIYSYILWCMRIVIFVFLSLIFLPRVVWSDVFGGDKYLETDLFIAKGEVYNPDSLILVENIAIENNGYLTTNIFLHDDIVLTIVNHAMVDSVFNLGLNSKIVQIISDSGDMNPINHVGNYFVQVENANVLSMRDIITFSERADKIIISDSVIDINNLSNRGKKSIELHGNVVFMIDNVSDDIVIDGVSGDATISLISNNENILFSNYAQLRNGALVLGIRRETDYVKIFNNEFGYFLNSLRADASADKLLMDLDSAQNIKDFNSVLGRSARFNSDVLSQPLRVLGYINSLRYKGPFGAGCGFMADAWGVLSEDFYSYGLGIGFDGSVKDKSNVGLRLNAGNLEYDGDYDIYDADLFGVDLFVEWMIDEGLWVNAVGGLWYEDLRIENVFYDGAVHENPRMFLGYLQTDVGYKFNLFDALYLNVWGGTKADFYMVEDFTNYDLNLYVGTAVVYAFDMSGIEYNYNVGFDVNSDADVGIFARAGFWSDVDMLGMDVQIGLFRVIDIVAYKISLGGRLVF